MNSIYMDATISFESYPIWYIALCLGLGLLYALVLYFKDNTFDEASKAQRRALIPMSVARFLVVSGIAFLLLSPLLKSRTTETVNPYVVVVQDNSESIAQGFAKTGDSSAYLNQLTDLVKGLKEKEFTVETYSFGEQMNQLKGDSLRLPFNQKVTNLSNTLDELYNKYSHQNVGAIILASDGIYNQGNNPIYSNAQLTTPIYAIALGDTTPQRDLIVEKVLHNRIAYLGDKFTIRADISAQNCRGATTVLNVYKGSGTSNKVYSKNIPIDKEDFVLSEDIILDANTVGVQQYSIRVNQVNEEVTTQNNRQDIYIDILDSRQKVLILAASPHPDVSALKQAVENNKNYETKTMFVSKTGNVSFKDYDVAILHGLPSRLYKAESVLSALKTNNIPILFVVSTQTDLAAFNRAQDILKINGGGSSSNDSKAKANRDFNLFMLENSVFQTLEELPPLAVPFGEFAAAPTTQSLLYQKIGSVDTQYPLLLLKQAAGYKTGVMTGEGLWRWRLYVYKKDNDHEAFNEIITKTVQYLSVKNDKRKFRVNMPKTLFNETEAITFDAELYNDSYELINEPEVNLVITDESGKEFPFVFNKTSNAYALNAGFFAPSKYSFKATTMFSGKEHTAKGTFTVVPIQLESLQTTANHQLLYSLTKRYGGQVFSPNNLTALADTLNNSPNIEPTLYSSYKTQAIINLKWLFFLLLAFLTIEWFLRKFIGGY